MQATYQKQLIEKIQNQFSNELFEIEKLSDYSFNVICHSYKVSNFILQVINGKKINYLFGCKHSIKYHYSRNLSIIHLF